MRLVSFSGVLRKVAVPILTKANKSKPNIKMSANSSTSLKLAGGCVFDEKSVPNYCLYGRIENNTVIYTIHSSAKGWASVAVGSSMNGADFYIGWKGTSKIILSRRGANGNKMPTPVSNQIASIVPLQKPAPSWANTAFSFSRPISSDNTISADSKYLVADSDASPLNIDDPNSSLSIHDFSGYVKGNFLCSGDNCVQGTLDFTHAHSHEHDHDHNGAEREIVSYTLSLLILLYMIKHLL